MTGRSCWSVVTRRSQTVRQSVCRRSLEWPVPCHRLRWRRMASTLANTTVMVTDTMDTTILTTTRRGRRPHYLRTLLSSPRSRIQLVSLSLSRCIIRLFWMHAMRRVVTDVHSVCPSVSVCLSRGSTRIKMLFRVNTFGAQGTLSYTGVLIPP